MLPILWAVMPSGLHRTYGAHHLHFYHLFLLSTIAFARLCASTRSIRQRKLFGEEPRRAFWQARFYDFNVWTTKKRVEKLRYMHRNPVKRGLVASPEQWRWSSYRHYLLQETGPVRINWDGERFRFRIGWREQ